VQTLLLQEIMMNYSIQISISYNLQPPLFVANFTLIMTGTLEETHFMTAAAAMTTSSAVITY
jgi:hypothetical protein